MKNLRFLLLPALLLNFWGAARADLLELKNGAVLEGRYLGGTAEVIRFQSNTGLHIIERSQIRDLCVNPPPVPARSAAPVRTSGPVTVPAGTVLLVRMMDSVSSRNSPGDSFATELASDLVANGVVAAEAGTVIYGRVESATQAGRAIGRSTLDIRLEQMVVGGKAVPLVTSGYAEASQDSLGKVAVAAGVGAIIGNNINGGGHGGGGALWGAGIAMLKPGQTLTIPPDALLEFTLTRPVTVPASRY